MAAPSGGGSGAWGAGAPDPLQRLAMPSGQGATVGLGASLATGPRAASVPRSAAPPRQRAQAAHPYSVRATKKGSLPVKVEGRARGKKVVIVTGVSGDAKALLSRLKAATGSGGAVCEGGMRVELQGDDKMATRVSAWLVSDGCVVGAAAARQAEVVADADRQVRKANKNRTKVHAKPGGVGSIAALDAKAAAIKAAPGKKKR